MSQYDDAFEWIALKKTVMIAFNQVHDGWKEQDLSKISECTTSHYWQNQQKVYLEDWQKKGLVKFCHVKNITAVSPILFIHRNHHHSHNNTKVVFAISAKMNDYLQNVTTKVLVEGSKKFKQVTTLWSFTLDNGKWKVSSIDESSLLMSFVNTQKMLPPIETTIKG